MREEFRDSIKSFEDTFNDIQLFQQDNYCVDFLKKNNNTQDGKNINYNAEIAASCFRQANEYIKSAKNAPITTSPLLYSYAINNYSKGLVHLLTFDESILSLFKKHGFSIKDDNIKENILQSFISLEKCGAPTALMRIFNNHILNKQNISFDLLLRHLPDLSDIYFKTTGKSSCTAQVKPNCKYEYIMKSDSIDEDIKEVMEKYSIHGTYIEREKNMYIIFSMATKGYIKSGEISSNNIFYKGDLILPAKFQEGIYDINVIIYCYLIIMGYGMLVRYNANKWEKFINPKISKEFTLIDMSIDICVKNFIIQLHKLLFGYIYVEKKYNDLDVKKVIDESTDKIMDNIKQELKHRELQYGIHDTVLPW